MAIVFTSKIDGTNSTDQSNYTTATYTPSASGVMVIVSFLHAQTAASIGDATSVTGASITGMTKIKTQGFASSASPTRKTEIWVGTSTGSAGTITIALPGTPIGCCWDVTEAVGADTTQGTGGVIQSVNDSNASAGNTALTITAAAFANANNRAFLTAGNSNGNNITITAVSGTYFKQEGIATPGTSMADMVGAANLLTLSGTWSTGGQWGGTIIEVAATSTATTATAGNAAGTGAAGTINPQPQPAAANAAGTSAAYNANPRPQPTAANAAGTGTAGNPGAQVAGTSGTATGTGTAYNPTVSTVAGTMVTPTTATGTGAAYGAGPQVQGSSGSATGTGAAGAGGAADTVQPATATATGAAYDATTSGGVVVTPPPPTPTQQVGGTLSGRRGPYTAIDAELEAILRDDEEILVLL